MLSTICGKTLRDDISNKTICAMTVAKNIGEFVREQKLQCFLHV